MAVQARPEKMTPQEMSHLSRSGGEELARLVEQLSRATKENIERPGDFDAELELEIAQLEQRLFFVEHDNAGAFKTKKLGRRLQEQFQPGPDGVPPIGFDERGDLRTDASLSDRRFMLVNMGELDRFNKEGGGHAAGDEALTATARAIEQTVNEGLSGKEGLQAKYEIYRFDGNTFAVDLASMPLAEFSKLVAKMQRAAPSVEGVKDPAPLTVRGVDFRDAVGLVNQLQAELPPEAKIDTPEEASRELFGMLRRMADWDLETAKFATRAERMKGKASDEDGRAFFDNYMKKAFQGTELETFDGFRQALDRGNFEELVDELALRHSEKRFADGRKVDDQIREMIDARVRERGQPNAQLEAPGKASFVDEGMKTGGMAVLANKRAKMEALEGYAAGLPAGDERAQRELEARAARLEFQIEAARRDGNTGLLDRGTHYEDLEEAIEQGRDVATVFVDMGFLKYFDQMGGTDVGDEALKTAAHLMEQAIQFSGVKGKVYRYGGDEFTIQVEGGSDAANKVIQELEQLRADEPPIPRTAKSREEYAPSRLSFNYGLADRAMLDELYRVESTGGKYDFEELDDPGRVRNIKAELMTKAADVGIEYNKAYSRFILLIDELRDPAYASDPLRKKQLDSKIDFSNKALFAELGGADHLRVLAADLRLEGEALDEAVLEYVVKMIDESHARERGQAQMMDLLLAAQTKVGFFKARVEALQQANAELAEVNDRQKASLERALAQRDAAEREKRELIDTRGAIDRAA